MPPACRVVLWVLALVGGAGAGLLGSFVHGSNTFGLPVGLLTALGLSLAVFAGAGLAGRSRGPSAVAVAGWLLIVLLLSLRRPEGDLVVPATLLGYLWLLGGMATAAAALSVPYAALRGTASGREASTAAAPLDR